MFAFRPLHLVGGPGQESEHGLELVDDEGDVAAAPEHRRDHARQRHRPRVVLHVLRIDEHLEGTAAAVVVDEIVEGDVNGVFAFRPLHLVGGPGQGLGPVEGLEHVDDGPGIAEVPGPRLGRRHLEGQLVLFGPVPLPRIRAGLEHGAGDLVGPERGAALAAQIKGLHVDVLEALE